MCPYVCLEKVVFDDDHDNGDGGENGEGGENAVEFAHPPWVSFLLESAY